LKEPDLVTRCQKGQAKAQQFLYDAFSDRVFRVASRYIKIQEDSEDVVMMAFVKIFQNINSFHYQGKGSLEAWIRQIAVNEALMWLRKRHNFNLTESLEPELHPPDLTAFKDIDAEYLFQLIVDLPTGYRTVFNLYVVEGYDHREIAGILNITENTSRSQLYKAKELLKKKIQQEGRQYGT
jgi:RNA polymerase sigma factor (sigma-70 family)